MLETFTPAVCGSRRRIRAAVALFAVSAVLAAALLGALLGLVGGLLGARQALLAAGVLALLAAAREAGLVRLPLPQMRRQVPERWRFERPLPVWATGYGAGLGVGVFTFQPVSTFWIACIGALTLARPLPAALCFSLYGAGRAATVLWARARPGDAGEAVERLVGRRRALLRANAVALAACAVLLFLAPAAGAGVVARWSIDPTVDSGIVAYARQNGSVVVRPGSPISYPGATAPSLDGGVLAYEDANGIRVVRWRTKGEIIRIDGPVSNPALDWPRLAFWRRVPRGNALVLRNLKTGTWRRIATYHTMRVGRPSLRYGRLAWHVTSRKWSGSTSSGSRAATAGGSPRAGSGAFRTPRSTARASAGRPSRPDSSGSACRSSRGATCGRSHGAPLARSATGRRRSPPALSIGRAGRSQRAEPPFSACATSTPLRGGVPPSSGGGQARGRLL